jgi:hypothetical protein
VGRALEDGVKRLARAFGTVSLLALVAIVGLGVAVALNLRSYARLTHEQPVAELSFAARGPQRWQATLTTVPDLERRAFDLAGDEWQLDARVLKWRGWANVLGLDARYRLERISGRYADVAQERSALRTVYALGEAPAVDLWALARDYPDWLPFVDAVYGSATYLPMADGATYEVSLTQSGLVARPQNAAARAVSGAAQR